MAHAKDAPDYPVLASDLFLIWRGNGSVWPSPNRSMVYLSADKKQLDGSATYSKDWSGAKTFQSRAAAGIWLIENRNKRSSLRWGRDHDRGGADRSPISRPPVGDSSREIARPARLCMSARGARWTPTSGCLCPKRTPGTIEHVRAYEGASQSLRLLFFPKLGTVSV